MYILKRFEKKWEWKGLKKRIFVDVFYETRPNRVSVYWHTGKMSKSVAWYDDKGWKFRIVSNSLFSDLPSHLMRSFKLSLSEDLTISKVEGRESFSECKLLEEIFNYVQEQFPIISIMIE